MDRRPGQPTHGRRDRRAGREHRNGERPSSPAPPAATKAVAQRGDRVFSGAAPTAGILILLVLAGVAVFLLAEAAPALTAPAEAIPGGNGLVALHLAAGVRHLAGRGPRAAHRHAARRRRSRCSSPTTRPAGSRRASATSSTCSPPSPASSTASGGSWSRSGRGRPFYDVAERLPRLHPALRRRRSRRRAARCSPSAIVLAVMILPIITAVSPRGLPADARAARGGRARARRDPLGDDPDGGAPVRPLRRHQRADARPRPRARRDDGRRDDPLGLRRGHVQPDQLAATRRRSPPTSRSSSPSRPASSVNALIASGLVLFVITLAST